MLKLSFADEMLEAGIDEAGRGCLAGPVVAAAVILPPQKKLKWYAFLDDSKKLSEPLREGLRVLIERDALAWAVGIVMPDEIDRINILNATYKAMHLAIQQLKIEPEFLLIDGNRFKSYGTLSHKCIIKGDGEYLAIAAASVLAKTFRDDYMRKLHDSFPQYGWDQNKAYATDMHINAIHAHGLSEHHRKTFHLKRNQLDLFREIEKANSKKEKINLIIK